jgi:hypothetical protein
MTDLGVTGLSGSLVIFGGFAFGEADRGDPACFQTNIPKMAASVRIEAAARIFPFIGV